MAELADISNTVTQFLELAQQQLASGETLAAEETARAVISLAPKAGEGWHALGEILSAEPGRRAEAADAFAHALLLNPDNENAHAGRKALSVRATAAPTNAEKQPILPYMAAMGGKDQLIADARAAEAAERWAEACKCWEAVLETDPSDTWAWSQYGHLLSVHLHRYADAEGAFRRAIEEDPTDDWAWGKLGIMIADFQGRVAEGQALLREAIRLDPVEPYYHGWLGWSLYRQSENLEKAEEELIEATRLQPDYQWAHFHLGYVRYAMGSKAKAARYSFRRALELEPRDIAALYNLGALYLEQLDNKQKAEKCFLKALKVDPEHAATHFKLAVFYEENAATYTKAEFHYRQILLRHPSDLSASRALANLYSENLQKFDEAKKIYAAALDIAPDDADLHYRFGCMLWYELAESSSAIAHLRKATELAPDIELGWASLGEVLAVAKGDFEGAEVCFLKALELEPAYYWVHAQYGAMLRTNLKRPEDARRHLVEATTLEPGFAWAWTQYAVLLCDYDKDFEAAHNAFLRAIAEDADDLTPLLLLASMHLITLKNPKEASIQLDVLEKRAPTSGFVKGMRALSLIYGQVSSAEIDSLLAEATDLDAGNHWCWHTCGEHLLYVKGDIGEAEEMLLRSMRLEHDCSEVSADLGLIRLAQGEQDIARALYEKALEDDDQSANSWRKYGMFLSYIGDDQGLVEEAFDRAIEYGPLNFENSLFLAHYLHKFKDRTDDAEELWAKAKSLAPKELDLSLWADLHMQPIVLRHLW